MSNGLMIQGAMFDMADADTKIGMTSDFSGPNACIRGVAAQVDIKCTPVPPAKDCYEKTWGAAIALNLNQSIDERTMMGGPVMPFDASALEGFAFEIAGNEVPTSLQFQVETDSGEAFCSRGFVRPARPGENFFKFDEL